MGSLSLSLICTSAIILKIITAGFQLVLVQATISNAAVVVPVPDEISEIEIDSNAIPADDDVEYAEYPPPCDSQIYCYGEILHTIQMAKLDKDSKTFVDKRLLFPPESVEDNFSNFIDNFTLSPTFNETRDFVNGNFDEPASEILSWTPPDWTANPSYLTRIRDPQLKTYARQLNGIWKTLGRKLNDDVRLRSDHYSLINVPNPFMVPGGRFREFYYWDQYWILKGLLISEMYGSVRGMIENFLFMIERFGYVPNGGRVYYTRSQPPLLIPMVKDYFEATHNVTFLRLHIKTLDKEFQFWMNNRTVNITTSRGGGGGGQRIIRLARYNNERTGPRPEAYREDYHLASELSTKQEKDELYVNLKSGAESGWDFSSRWFVTNETVGSLKNIRTRDIIPVDLNAFIYLNAKIMAKFHHRLGKFRSSLRYESIAEEWKSNINTLLWDPTLGSWFDYDLTEEHLRKDFYPSNIVPLWANISQSPPSGSGTGTGTGIFAQSPISPRRYTIRKILNYLQASGALGFPGGIPTSMEHTGEQWDFPNGWAPLQHLVVEALERSGDADAQALAFDLAQRWVQNNYRAFKHSNDTMFEKYDVQSVGSPGGGGEYEIVTGFGWSNGVIIDFLHKYGQRLTGMSAT